MAILNNYSFAHIVRIYNILIIKTLRNIVSFVKFFEPFVVRIEFF
jgi:hypothetical protein